MIHNPDLSVLTAAQKRRYHAIASNVNRQWAYAIVMGQHTEGEARQFCNFVVSNGLGASNPADNLDLWYEA